MREYYCVALRYIENFLVYTHHGNTSHILTLPLNSWESQRNLLGFDPQGSLCLAVGYFLFMDDSNIKILTSSGPAYGRNRPIKASRGYNRVLMC